MPKRGDPFVNFLHMRVLVITENCNHKIKKRLAALFSFSFVIVCLVLSGKRGGVDSECIVADGGLPGPLVRIYFHRRIGLEELEGEGFFDADGIVVACWHGLPWYRGRKRDSANRGRACTLSNLNQFFFV